MVSSNRDFKNILNGFSAEKLRLEASRKASENHKFLKFLAGKDSRTIDSAFHELHSLVFSQINCLDCGNCCQSLGPRITHSDLRRLPASLRMTPGKFIDQYLMIDEDGDYVFKAMPCPFLGGRNICAVYSDRPRACREYPHTNRQRMYQVLDITMKNLETCPAVFAIVEELKKMKW